MKYNFQIGKFPRSRQACRIYQRKPGLKTGWFLHTLQPTTQWRVSCCVFTVPVLRICLSSDTSNKPEVCKLAPHSWSESLSVCPLCPGGFKHVCLGKPGKSTGYPVWGWTGFCAVCNQGVEGTMYGSQCLVAATVRCGTSVPGPALRLYS